MQPELAVDPLDLLLARHELELFQFKQLTGPEQARTQLRMRAHYHSNPWAFLSDNVFTLDQVSQNNPVKPYPSYLEYLEFLTAVWLKHKYVVVPKSRRMFCSWNFISLYLHDTIFNPGRLNGFVSKKEDDSGELVSRAEFIYNHIPEWRIPKALLPPILNGKMSKQPPTLSFESINSKIQGYPQGSDQLRQFTFSGLLFDEWAFWELAQKSYSSAKPTLDGGGRLTGISSRSPGFLKKIVFDRIDSQDLTFREVPPVPVKTPLEGVEVWKNPGNKFVVVDLHYSANPAKRSKAWRDEIKNSMPIRDYMMEYEKSWQTYEGKPVYEDFQKAIHTTKETIEPEPGLPLLLGFDFGLTPACLLGQLVGNQLRILEEFIEADGSILKLAPVIWKHLRVNYEPWASNADESIISFVDPAGFQRAQTDAKTCAGILRQENFKKIIPGPVNWEARRQAVENFLVRLTKQGPGLLISDKHCPILVEGFMGGYQYPSKAIEIEPAKIAPLKNKFSHVADALQYLCAGAAAKQKQYTGQSIPTPSYQQG